MTNREWEQKILWNRKAVSDISQFTASAASESCIDPDRAVIYSTYLASRKNYGETRDSVILAKIPVGQPEKTETIPVIEKGTVIDGVTYNEFLDCNAYFYQTEEYETVKTHFGETGNIYRGFVRILFLAVPEDYFYTDYDIKNGTFTPYRRLRALVDGEETVLTGTAYQTYLRNHGLSGYGNSGDPGENVILTDKVRLAPDGYRYTFITAKGTQPVFARIRDGSDRVEMIGHIPVEGEYETQSALLNGTYYAIVRGVAEGENFWTSEDMGRTWKPGCRYEFNVTRPQCLEYFGKVLVAVSVCGILPNLVRDGRNNLRLLYGEGPDLSTYEEIFTIQDARGIVYYDIVNYKGDLYVIWSDGSLQIDKNPQAKDALFMARIGDLRFIE